MIGQFPDGTLTRQGFVFSKKTRFTVPAPGKFFAFKQHWISNGDTTNYSRVELAWILPPGDRCLLGSMTVRPPIQEVTASRREGALI